MNPRVAIRLECLKLAARPGRSFTEAMAEVKEYEKYVVGDDDPNAMPEGSANTKPAPAQAGGEARGPGKPRKSAENVSILD